MTRATASASLAVLAVAAAVVALALSGPRGAPSTTARESGAVASAADNPQVSATSMGSTVPRYGVIERTFGWRSTGYSNPWEQVRLTMALISPSGRRYQIGGFYAAPNRWATRFSPSETGHWTWR
ncbi:MAG: DUF5060 domain-containing protein, partial [Pseudonocardiaceae bacterium]